MKTISMPGGAKVDVPESGEEAAALMRSSAASSRAGLLFPDSPEVVAACTELLQCSDYFRRLAAFNFFAAWPSALTSEHVDILSRQIRADTDSSSDIGRILACLAAAGAPGIDAVRQLLAARDRTSLLVLAKLHDAGVASTFVDDVAAFMDHASPAFRETAHRCLRALSEGRSADGKAAAALAARARALAALPATVLETHLASDDNFLVLEAVTGLQGRPGYDAIIAETLARHHESWKDWDGSHGDRRLKEMGPRAKAAVPILLGALRDAGAKHAGTIVACLSSIGESSDAVAGIVAERFRNRSGETWDLLRTALEWEAVSVELCRNRAFMQRVLEAETSPSPGVRESLAVTLGLMRAATQEVRGVLLRLRRDLRVEVASAAARSLRQLAGVQPRNPPYPWSCGP